MKYCTTLLASTLCVLALAALYNRYYDPFGVWRDYQATAALSPRLQMKPGIDVDPRFAKPLQVQRLKPQTIIVGSSRVRDGMDPAILAGLAPAPVMNYGTAGMRATEGARFIRHAIDVADVKCVIWGLDFFGFNDRERDEMGSDGFGILGTRLRIQDKGRLLIAWPTLELSFSMLRTPLNTTRADGFNLAPATPPEAIDISIMRNAVGFAKAPFLYGKFDSFVAHMQEVEQTLEYAVSKGVRVYLYTSPLHGLVIESIFQAGSQSAFLRWKLHMAHLSHRLGIPAWDYMNYNSISNIMGGEAAEYFFDGAHFTPTVSRMILGQWFEVDSQRPADFGEPLVPERIRGGWARLLRDRTTFAAAHKDMVEDLRIQLQ